MTFTSFLCAVDLVDLDHNTFGGFGRFSEDLVDLAKRWIWTFAPNPPPRLYKTRKVDLDSVTEKLSKTLEVDLVDLDFKFAKTPKVDLKGFEHRCDIWRSRWTREAGKDRPDRNVFRDRTIPSKSIL